MDFIFTDIIHSLVLHLVIVMVSQLHFCVEISQWTFLRVWQVLGCFFPSFWCAFHWCSFIAFSLLWTLRAFPLLFHLIVRTPILLPSLLEGKGLGLIFPMKESSWTLEKPSKTKLWGRLQCSQCYRNYVWWMFQDRVPLEAILTHKHQVQETESIWKERISYWKPLQQCFIRSDEYSL